NSAYFFLAVYNAVFSLRYFFFFFTVLLPPISTLFPTRRSSDLCRVSQIQGNAKWSVCFMVMVAKLFNTEASENENRVYTGRQARSEEHTSELQSRGHLVCRLLLEKKKNKDHIVQIFSHQTSAER